MKRLLSIVLVLVFLAGCSAAPVAVPIPAASASPEATVVPSPSPSPTLFAEPVVFMIDMDGGYHAIYSCFKKIPISKVWPIAPLGFLLWLASPTPQPSTAATTL